jgi:cell division protein ZapE
MAKLFDTLSGHSGKGGVDVRIEGRDIHALNCGVGVIWFDFADLCEGPRSQNDYIELAHSYHTIFISSVPILDAQHENAARRFVMLVDEAYDRHVNLVLSTAAPPDQLYQGERLRFEFQRTSSRLIEMQSQEYLAGEHRA